MMVRQGKASIADAIHALQDLKGDMSTEFRQIDKRTSAMLSEIARSLPSQGLTLRELMERLGEHGLLMFSMMLTIPFLLPVSIPGSSLPFGLIIALNAVGTVTHRSPWLPARLMNRRLTADHLVMVLGKGTRVFARLEKWIHPRLALLTHGATFGRLNGILLGFSGIMLMAPLPLPLSNTLPAYAVLFLAAGSLERDGYLIIAGYVMVFLTIVYFGLVALLGGLGAQAILPFL
jgi:hypothetical protein